jgi:hypothetical protein
VELLHQTALQVLVYQDRLAVEHLEGERLQFYLVQIRVPSRQQPLVVLDRFLETVVTEPHGNSR